MLPTNAQCSLSTTYLLLDSMQWICIVILDVCDWNVSSPFLDSTLAATTPSFDRVLEAPKTDEA